MTGYVTLGTNDFERAAAFYDELLAVYGAKRAVQNEFSARRVSVDVPL